MKKYHLLHDIGIYKRTLLNHFHDNDRDEEFDKDLALMNERRQMYTLEEIKDLAGWMMTGHLECVLNNPEDYSRVEFATAEHCEREEKRVHKLIKQLEAEEQRELLLSTPETC